MTELGGDPAYLSGDARLVDAVNDCVLGQTANSKRHWYYRLELLLVYEIRDATIGEVLEQASSAAADPDVADVLERTVLPVASGETAFAHDTPSHRQRLEWLQTTMRTAVLADLGLKPQTRWHRLLHW